MKDINHLLDDVELKQKRNRSKGSKVESFTS